MDFDSIGDSAILIVIIVALIALQFFLGRRRRGERTQREIVQNLLLEVRLDQMMVEAFHQQQKPKTFEVTSWQLYKNKLDFLGKSLQDSLSNAYMIIEDCNHQIKTAKKYKSTSYMVSLDLNKLKEPLIKSREGLEQWLQRATGSKEPRPEYRSMLDDLFGRR